MSFYLMKSAKVLEITKLIAAKKCQIRLIVFTFQQITAHLKFFNVHVLANVYLTSTLLHKEREYKDGSN